MLAARSVRRRVMPQSQRTRPGSQVAELERHPRYLTELCARLPNVRITPRVKNRQHHDPMRLRKKVHGVWKAASLNAANCAMLDGKPLGMIGRKFHSTLNLRCELGAKSDLPFFVPQRRSVKLGSRRAAKNDPQGQLFKRAVIED